MSTIEAIVIIGIASLVCIIFIWGAYTQGYQEGHTRGYLDAMKRNEDSTWKWTRK